MPTARQELGQFAETLVAKSCTCPRCKRSRTLIRLPTNFKCADLICDFCGYLAQVKGATVRDVGVIPGSVMGAAWGPQKERMESGIYFPLFLVLVTADKTQQAIFYPSADLQRPEMFRKRNPLGSSARRAGWTGFNYDT
ncbi:DpnI domain-containing protein [Phreatobacter sp.]|uniref:DpnI domain-containing protein n=1 Tax=Phreatobacter sp. TaxID=1966341 RepID=UPI0025F96E5B|nr:DpnI domain-containing protein [Phreatobacter sp.]